MRKEKIRETDFIQAERPETRLKQFFDIVKHRFLELVKISMLQTIFNMPLFVSIILFYSVTAEQVPSNSWFTVFLIHSLWFLIAMPSSFVGTTGTFYCMKRLAYAEGEFATSSFFIGLKEEWKKGAAIGLIAGISLCLLVIGTYMLYIYVGNNNALVTGFGIAILITQALIVLMVCYYSIAQTVVYSNELKFVLKNSFIFTLVRFPFNLLITILFPVSIAVSFCFGLFCFIGIGLTIFFGAFAHLGWMLNAICAFDKFINKEQYPNYYRKGLAIINTSKED